MRAPTARPPRRPRLRLAAAGVLALLAAAGLASAAGAQEPSGADLGGIDVVQVDGFLDPMNATLLEQSVEDAEERGSTVLVFQLDSPGAVDVDVERLARVVRDARVPIAFWVGPSGVHARGGAALVAFAAPFVSMAPGSGIGPVEPLALDDPREARRAEISELAGELQAARDRSLGTDDAVVTRRLSARDAVRAGVVDRIEPTLGDLIVALDGRTLETADGRVRLSTAEFVGEGDDLRRQPNQPVRLAKLGLVQQAQHTLSTPWVAYLLLVVGFALLVFEFYTVSVGIAGGVGAIAVAAACYGFSHLPAQWWAVVLLAVGILGLAVDLQAGGLGPWTFIGSASLVAGSLWLYGGSSRLDPAWWIVVLVCVSTVVFMVSGMTAMVRSRFSTPTVGREDLVGEMGSAEVDVAPDGVVRVRDALWRARTNRATPVRAGEPVRVVAVEGVVLEVEPEEGGARDYRERRPRSPRHEE